ncbi:MAG: 50S ribosomal protein L18 [Candidatus Aenigmarchaeota archaeon]|nr:50S ribosomal protein L18 [Candidatus Aenigmarchaeota archaeon]
MLKRRLNEKTDYRQRLALLKSGLPRLVIRKTNNKILIQIVEFIRSGDKTLTEASSLDLASLGWKGHSGSVPAAYLAGMLAATKAIKHGVKEAIADIGLQYSRKGVAIYAAIKGAKDAGLNISAGEAFPDDARIRGEHIAQYAKLLKSKNKAAYEKQFSSYLKSGFNPEDIAKNFDEVKLAIKNAKGNE